MQLKQQKNKEWLTRRRKSETGLGHAVHTVEQRTKLLELQPAGECSELVTYLYHTLVLERTRFLLVRTRECLLFSKVSENETRKAMQMRKGMPCIRDS